MPNGDALDVTFNVWDEGQDVAAASEVLKNQTWECELAFSINVPVSIMGETDTVISQPGSSSGVFAITKFEGSGTNLQLVATCTSPESGRTITGRTNSFILFPGSAESSVGLLRKTSLAMAYSGPYQVVQGIVDAFNTELGSLQCDGTSCPAPSNGTARMGRVTGVAKLNMATLNVCSMPICQAQDKTCKC